MSENQDVIKICNYVFVFLVFTSEVTETTMHMLYQHREWWQLKWQLLMSMDMSLKQNWKH